MQNLDNNFRYKILSSDESRFTNWAQKNPKIMRMDQDQVDFNVWLCIIGRRIIGLIIIDGALNGARYLEYKT